MINPSEAASLGLLKACQRTLTTASIGLLRLCDQVQPKPPGSNEQFVGILGGGHTFSNGVINNNLVILLESDLG